MSLDVGFTDRVGGNRSSPLPLSFDDDGYYWFCYPYFEQLATQTRQMIDLYGTAWFDGPHLDDLRQLLDGIANDVRRIPETRDVCVGYSINPAMTQTPRRPINKAVERDELLALVTRFTQLVNEAKDHGHCIVCLGD